MKTKAIGTLSRAEKGPIEPPPVLDGPLREIVDAVAGWPGIRATVHWDLVDRSRVDGVDFYLAEEELGHLHLDGSIHLATNARLGGAMVAEGVARRFRFQQGWVEEDAGTIGPEAAIVLFRRNYDELMRAAVDADDVRDPGAQALP